MHCLGEYLSEKVLLSTCSPYAFNIIFFSLFCIILQWEQATSMVNYCQHTFELSSKSCLPLIVSWNAIITKHLMVVLAFMCFLKEFFHSTHRNNFSTFAYVSIIDLWAFWFNLFTRKERIEKERYTANVTWPRRWGWLPEVFKKVGLYFYSYWVKLTLTFAFESNKYI